MINVHIFQIKIFSQSNALRPYQCVACVPFPLHQNPNCPICRNGRPG